MNKKRIIIVAIILTLAVIVGLWASGIIPKQIAKICATNYLKKNFPKAQLEYVDIEWSPSYGGYLIRFKDENNKIHSFIINNKYFPIKLGQGVFAFREEYTEKYDKVEWDTDIGDYRVIKKINAFFQILLCFSTKSYLKKNPLSEFFLERLD